jgi:hypothetical protein
MLSHVHSISLRHAALRMQPMHPVHEPPHKQSSAVVQQLVWHPAQGDELHCMGLHQQAQQHADA